jgi:hypothetical protein
MTSNRFSHRWYAKRTTMAALAGLDAAAGADHGQRPGIEQAHVPLHQPDSGKSGEPLLAYLYLRRGAGSHTQAVLEGHIRAFADREGFALVGLLVATEGPVTPIVEDRPSAETCVAVLGGRATGEQLRDLAEQLELTGARKVLVVGPARQALVLLHRMQGIHLLTLAQVRPVNVERSDNADSVARRRSDGVRRAPRDARP